MLVEQSAHLKEAPLRLRKPASSPSTPRPSGEDAPQRSTALFLLCGLWALLFFASLFAPHLLDDADATHANAARHIALTGDWVTLHVNGIRYLEKAPLPYWLVAISFRIFGFNTFAAHLPQAIGVLLLALLGYVWAEKSFGLRTALYTGIATLTAVGVFLFTRIFIPEVLLSLFLCIALYAMLDTLQRPRALTAYAMWTALALAVLTKGLVALVFFGGAGILYLILSGEYRRWRSLRPFTGTLLFLAIAAPWHILAGLRNTGGMNGHGFFWFYFVNEHFLRFLGKRIPMDYNKLPGPLYWSLHLVWLFPWALFVPVVCLRAWTAYRRHRDTCISFLENWPMWTIYGVAVLGMLVRAMFHVPYLLTVSAACAVILLIELRRRQRGAPGTSLLYIETAAERTTLLLTIYAALILVFFSLSTNQEYYTFPAYLPLLMLLANALVRTERASAIDKLSRNLIAFAQISFTVLGAAISLTLAYGLWTSRHQPFVADIGGLLAHRGVGDYTLSMSHFFDLTGPSFAALRLPASLAALAFAVGPALAWMLRRQQRHLAATSAIAATSALFLIAAHIALLRFEPMLSSANFAARIQSLEHQHAIAPNTALMLYGDQAYGSSIPFYLGRDLDLVEGRSTSMLFGSTFPDAPHIFLTNADLLASWGRGQRKLLFVPLEKRDAVDKLLGSRQLILAETSGKALVTDRPLDR